MIKINYNLQINNINMTNNITETIKDYFIDNSIILPTIRNSIITLNNASATEHFIFKKMLANGSYGKLYLYESTISKLDKYIIKISLGAESNDALIAEIKIHSILSAFQQLYLINKLFYKKPRFYPKVAPNIKYIFRDARTGMNIIMMEKYDGDIYRKLTMLNVRLENDRKFLIELLFQISCQLRLLQKHFEFMHNDLKANNIFYKLIDPTKELTFDNTRFVLADFGGACITFGKFVTKGDVKGSEIDFNQNKDLFMLIHLIITFIDPSYRISLVDLLSTMFTELNLDIAVNESDSWHQLYTKSIYPDEYNPKLFLERLCELYPEYK
jgi:hypothetical protein|uniref:Protein kinase domain-containing protein n=1 Tax=viral metagenome TaxID=1070528 RepID=A0A6C0IUW0_9ZZZZ